MKIIPLNTLPAPHHKRIGHRGVCKRAPENTLASFKLAADSGLSWVEFDVQLTKDDQLVIIHDERVDRTTNKTGLVSEYTLAEIQQLDAGGWFAPEFTNEKIPSLIETIPLLEQWGLMPNIEIKCEENQAEHLTQKITYRLADCLLEYWPLFTPLPLVSSFDHRALFFYRERLMAQKVTDAALAPIGFLVDGVMPEHVAVVKKTPNSALHCSRKYTTPERVQELVQEGITVLVYTVNDPKQGEAYLQAGAFAIFTDDPSVFL